jgi:hypothetical protein
VLQCIACNGTYEPQQPNGYTYFHVCPPLSAPELEDAVAKGAVQFDLEGELAKIPMSKVRPEDTDLDVRGRKLAMLLSERQFLRPGHRDENIREAPRAGAPLRIVSEGMGVRSVPRP